MSTYVSHQTHAGSSQLSSRGSPPAIFQGHTAASPPVNRSASGTPSSIGSSSKPKQKPVNIFSNDGSFIERFQRRQKEDEEKQKREEEMKNKLNFEERFKKRGKRRAASSEPSNSIETSLEENPMKKAKTKADSEASTTAYEKEVKSYTDSSNLKDLGTGVRPLVK